MSSAKNPVKIVRKLITPKLALDMLKNNTGNYRRLEKERVARYATDMTNGSWDFLGNPIKFDKRGILTDGQHRLHAIVKSGKTIDTVIITGIELSCNEDTGRPRTVADWIRHAGLPGANALAAIARNALMHEKGLWHLTGWGSNCASNQEVITFLKKNADQLIDAMRLAAHARVICPQSFLAPVLYIGCGKKLASENEVCSWFANSLALGENLTGEDPVFLLRGRLLDKSPSSRIPPYMKRMLITLAWNKTTKGEKSKTLRLILTGPRPMQPPTTIFQA